MPKTLNQLRTSLQKIKRAVRASANPPGRLISQWNSAENALYKLKVQKAAKGLSVSQAQKNLERIVRKIDQLESMADLPENYNPLLRGLMDRQSFAFSVLREVLRKNKK